MLAVSGHVVANQPKPLRDPTHPATMHNFPFQSAITGMRARCVEQIRIIIRPVRIHRSRSSRHAETMPNLGLFRAVDNKCVMSPCAPIIISPIQIAVVGTDTGIDDHSLPRHRHFETQRIAVSVRQLMLRAQRAAVEDQKVALLAIADREVSAFIKYAETVALSLGRAQYLARGAHDAKG